MAQSSADFNLVSYYNELFARAGEAFKGSGAVTSMGLERLAQTFDRETTLKGRFKKPLPLFQVPDLQLPLRPGLKNDCRLDWLTTCATNFKELGGDLFESLLWEPLFTGRWAPRSTEFNSVAASLYGASLWYKELILAPRLRGTSPLAEILITPTRHIDSNFHLYRAFAARGYSDLQLNCEVFSRLCSRRKIKLLPTNFLDELTQYLGENLFARSDLFARLSDAGFWNGYHERFLVPARGISLLSEKIADLLSLSLVDDYIFAVYESLENAFPGVDERIFAAVKCRRSIQQRALQTIQLRALISRKEFSFPKTFSRSYAFCILDIYLEMLESALATLVKDRDGKRATREYRAADEFYSAHLRDYFAETKVIGRLSAPKKPLEFALENLNFADDPKQSLHIVNGVLEAMTGNDRALEKLEALRNFSRIALMRIEPTKGELYELSLGKSGQ